MKNGIKKRMKEISGFLFIDHPFAGPFLVLICCGLPWWFAFWPGTLQHDSCGQLLQYLGVGKMTGHHPVPVTLLMGIFLDVGRALFDSDNAGIFIYTFLQFVIQCAVISYGFCVFERLRLPLWFRWVSLAFYGLFPLLPNWGISYVKDSGYYICFLLLIISMLDVFDMEEGQAAMWKRALWIAALAGLCAFRNDGRYVAVTAAIVTALFRRKYLKTCLAGIGGVFLFLFLVEGVYMPLQHIPSGSVREAMSVPLLQTAGYLKEYPDEVTAEERDAILGVFEVNELSEISDRYNSVISDELKDLFLEYPDRGQLATYLKVWLAQLMKHPGTYLRVYWEHCSGYFNPLEKCYIDVIGWYTIVDGQSRSDEYLDIHFIADRQRMREGLENWSYCLYDFPLTGWLYHTGVYTWILLGCMLFLIMKKRKRDLFLFFPGVIVLLVCTASPLNASIRYYLPVMAAAPVFIGYCMKNSGREIPAKEQA